MLALALTLAWPWGTPAALAAGCGLTYDSPLSIAEDTTWSLADSPVCIRSMVTVFVDVTLTVKPGVVVKFLETGSTLVVNGTLSARGTSAQRIHFTSAKDDAAGGDTNGDGSATLPARGDWRGIYLNGGGGLNGSADLAFVEVRYGGNPSWGYGNLLAQYSDALTLTNSTFTQSGSSGVKIQYATGLTSIANSLSTGNQGWGIEIFGASATIHSSDLVSNGGGLYLSDAGGIVVRNTVVANNGGDGLQVSGPAPTLQNNDFWGNLANYAGIADQTAINGNISADPLFLDFARGDYHLKAGSPAIDSGTDVGAPARDMDGDVRPQGRGHDIGFDEWKAPPTAVGLVSFGAVPGGPGALTLTSMLVGLLVLACGLVLRYRRRGRKGSG